MKHRILITTILSGVLTFSTYAMAADTNSASATSMTSASAASAEDNFGQIYTLASQMLGHARMADDALAYGLYSEASDNINTAQKEASDLVGQVPNFNASYAKKFGAAHKTANGQPDYLVPVIDNTVAVRDINAKHVTSTNPRVDVTDAQTVNYKLFLDTKQASDALTQAQSLMSQQKYDEALIALQGITNGAIMEATAYETPLAAVRDNLLLAREMINNKQYKSASYALSHAKSELTRAQKADKQLAASNDVKDLQSQISDMQTTLSKDDPSLLEKAKMKIDGWIQKIDSHMHEKS